MGLLVFWFITVFISVVLFRYAIKFDYKYNRGMGIEELFDEVFIIIMIIVTLIPVLNLIVSFVICGASTFTKFSNMSRSQKNKLVKKVFLIKDKEELW